MWAQYSFRNYLYGVNELNSYTNHRLKLSKIKRCKSLIDSFNEKIFYKPGKENHVVDALSRQHINMIKVKMEARSDCASTQSIAKVDKPVNFFRNQEGGSLSKWYFIIFG